MTRLVALVCAGVLLLGGCASATQSPPSDTAAPAGGDSPTTSGSTAASGTPESLDFRAETVSGERFEGADLAGRPTVLWFWAPWCPTCRGQIPGVGELAATYGPDVNVVGVGSLDEPEAIEGFAAEVSDDVVLLNDPDGAVWRHFEVTAQSTYVVLDEAGAEVESGYLDDAELVTVVDGLVG